jgi:hypothetical protein
VVKHHRILATALNPLMRGEFAIRQVKEFAAAADQIAERPKFAEKRERPKVFLLVATWRNE